MARREALEPYDRIDSNEAMAMLDSDPDNIVVVDVRNDDEWASGHVTGALHLFIDEITDRIEELPKDKKLLFICAIGVRSAKVGNALLRHGHKQAIHLKGGLEAWKQAGFETARAA